MGGRVNLIKLLGFPRTFTCPTCKNKSTTNFENFVPEQNDLMNGVFSLPLYCGICDDNGRKPYEFRYRGTIRIENLKIEAD